MGEWILQVLVNLMACWMQNTSPKAILSIQQPPLHNARQVCMMSRLIVTDHHGNETSDLKIHNYHMARTAPCALSLQNYWENSRMRAVRISASRAGKSRTALLRTGTAPRDAIIGDFVAFKHDPSNLQPEKQCKKHIR